MNARVLGVAAVVVAAITFAACGGDDGGGASSEYKEPSGEPQETVTIRGGNLFFDPDDEIELPAGVDAIELQGEGGLHTLVFDDGKVPGFKLEVQSDGDSDELKLDLKPGTYSFYCDVPGHRSGGMEGTLTVT